jgi:hypothetical protein
MSTNVGTFDRVTRVVVGLILLTQVFWGAKTALGWIGLVPLATAAIGFCPIYRMFGISTCATGPKDASGLT